MFFPPACGTTLSTSLCEVPVWFMRDEDIRVKAACELRAWDGNMGIWVVYDIQLGISGNGFFDINGIH